jgi:hypothetical protein
MACSRCGNGLGTCVCLSSAGPGMAWDNDSPTGRRAVLASPHVGAVDVPIPMQHHFKLATGRVLRAGPGVVLVLMPNGDVEAVREESLKLAIEAAAEAYDPATDPFCYRRPQHVTGCACSGCTRGR